ncbi:hypothetical protein RED65_04245 [Oceanobacter sp. RED65]|uniref:Uncharacterized protein n=1 Tax=Bermanella marisrubri TaxID=207949 RepID=Q1N1S6_9GAMM|nr:hypothetical protein RED65_04245 [Oceanobacter sp. RED65] [Bermanella marisrubri]
MILAVAPSYWYVDAIDMAPDSKEPIIIRIPTKRKIRPIISEFEFFQVYALSHTLSVKYSIYFYDIYACSVLLFHTHQIEVPCAASEQFRAMLI